MDKELLKARAQALLDASYLVHEEVMKTTDVKTIDILQRLYIRILHLLEKGEN